MVTTSKHYLLGVDTGGTYTDAAVIEPQSRTVIASAKALTTKGDLSIGVSEAIRAAVASLPEGVSTGDVALLSVSTTLATNAVVEGHGDPVGVVLIGFDDAMAARTGIAKGFPDLPLAVVGGGHDHGGNERARLDTEALEGAVRAMDARVTAFAVSAAFAVRNPDHEHRARALVQQWTGKPVTVSTEISSALDAPRRALTATLNARLIGRVTTLIRAVERSMSELGIDCPLMLVKGDGSLALASSVVLRPIETVLSGPAASMVGAHALSGLDDFVMSDMGGTTTDTGVMRGARPVLNPYGSEVGGWRTMVSAIDIRTIGLGGDSEVVVRDGSVTLGSTRCLPVSLLASRHPEILELLQVDLADVSAGSFAHGRFLTIPFGANGADVAAALDDDDAAVYRRVIDRPVPLRRVQATPAIRRTVERLRRRGIVVLSTFTPSDAAHVLGLQSTWSTEAAELAAKLGARLHSMRPPTPERVEAFARAVWDAAVTKSARAVLDAAASTGDGTAHDGVLLDLVSAGRGRLGNMVVNAAPDVPVVAVGGPVKVFYPEVGARLGCEVVFPPNCEVANAVGAATSVVARTVTVTVESHDGGGFTVHSDEGMQLHASALDALDAADALASGLAGTAVERMGATTSDVQVRRELLFIPGTEDDPGCNGLISAIVTAEAVGRPDLALP